MKIIDAVRSRRSVRTFSGEPLKKEDIDQISDFAREAANPYNLPIDWMFFNTKESGLSTPVIVGEDTYIAGKMLRAEHAEEAFGYSFERIVLFAESIGIGTTWIAGTMNRSSFEKAVSLAENEVMPCVSPLGYPAKKMSVRETVMRKGVKADSRFDFFDIFFDGSFDIPLKSESAGKLQTALEAVRLAPSAVNKQPWRVAVCDNCVHFYEKRSKARAEGEWDIQKIDMGIALCHFELVAAECGLNVSFCIENPGLPVGENTVYIASYKLND